MCMNLYVYIYVCVVYYSMICFVIVSVLTLFFFFLCYCRENIYKDKINPPLTIIISVISLILFLLLLFFVLIVANDPFVRLGQRVVSFSIQLLFAGTKICFAPVVYHYNKSIWRTTTGRPYNIQVTQSKTTRKLLLRRQRYRR